MTLPAVQYEPPEWHERAACRGMDTNIFFPTRGTAPRYIPIARAVCAQCPVLEDCHYEAIHILGADDRFGFRAGMTDRARRAERKRLGGVSGRKKCASRDCSLPSESSEFCPDHTDRRKFRDWVEMYDQQ